MGDFTEKCSKQRITDPVCLPLTPSDLRLTSNPPDCPVTRPMEAATVEDLVRLWAHEALRLFQDRLVHDEERTWTNEHVDEVALRHFPNINKEAALKRPILYSNWLSKDYVPVDQEELREYVKARLKVSSRVPARAAGMLFG